MSECIIAEGGRHPEERWGSWGVDAADGRDEEAARGTREISQGLRSGADDGKDVEGSEMDGGFSKEDVCRDVEVGSWLMLSPVTTLFPPSGLKLALDREQGESDCIEMLESGFLVDFRELDLFVEGERGAALEPLAGEVTLALVPGINFKSSAALSS